MRLVARVGVLFFDITAAFIFFIYETVELTRQLE